MLVQCSILESRLKSLVESQLKALNGNGPSAGSWGYSGKYIQFQVTCPCSEIKIYADILKANAAEIMSRMQFQEEDGGVAGYNYDFDDFPVFDIENGTFGEGSFWPNKNSSIENEPWYNGYGPYPLSPAESISVVDAVVKKLRMTWVYFPDIQPNRQAFITNTFPVSSAYYGENGNAATTAINSISPPTDIRTPSYGSVFQIPLPEPETRVAAFEGVPFWPPVVFNAFVGQTNTLAFTGSVTKMPIGNAGNENTGVGGENISEL